MDFSYEVSRSLAACEGALLVVDASQGVEAQTVANTYAAVEAGLELIPVLNKVDLPGAEPERVAAEVTDLIGGDPDEVLRISAKTGEGVAEVLEAIVERIPPPEGTRTAPPRALIFDSEYDPYRGVVAYVRLIDGAFRTRTDRRHAGRDRGRHRPDSDCRDVLSRALGGGENDKGSGSGGGSDTGSTGGSTNPQPSSTPSTGGTPEATGTPDVGSRGTGSVPMLEKPEDWQAVAKQATANGDKAVESAAGPLSPGSTRLAASVGRNSLPDSLAVALVLLAAVLLAAVASFVRRRVLARRQP